ncbi:MAG: hypothetical protein M3O61_02770 [Gemmatimonadota bacterium]|nr:hypothetical protein [Gemmatimonadota bacterium]
MNTRIAYLTGLMVATASNLGAQAASQNSPSPAPQAVDSPTPNASEACDYNTCALRMKLSWGNWRILRGEREQRVGTLGMFRAPKLESIVATSPEAVTEARTFRNNYTSGEVLQAVGVILMGIGVASASGNDSEVIPFTGVIGGGALLFYGVSRHVRAFNALHKAIWLYNGSLKR